MMQNDDEVSVWNQNLLLTIECLLWSKERINKGVISDAAVAERVSMQNVF